MKEISRVPAIAEHVLECSVCEERIKECDTCGKYFNDGLIKIEPQPFGKNIKYISLTPSGVEVPAVIRIIKLAPEPKVIIPILFYINIKDP